MSLDSRANPIIAHYYSSRCFCDSSKNLKKGHRGEADNQKNRITRGWHGVLFFAKTNLFVMADSPFPRLFIISNGQDRKEFFEEK